MFSKILSYWIAVAAAAAAAVADGDGDGDGEIPNIQWIGIHRYVMYGMYGGTCWYNSTSSRLCELWWDVLLWTETLHALFACFLYYVHTRVTNKQYQYR